MTAAQAGAALKKFGIGNPLPTFIIGAAAYIVALGASLVVIASFFLAALTADTPDVPGAGSDPFGSPTGPGTGPSPTSPGFRGILGLIGIPFQMVALGTFGSYDVNLSIPFFGAMEISWRGLPLLITLALVVTAFVGAWLAQRRLGNGRWGSNGVLGALLWSGISGFTLAVIALIITRITAFQVDDPELGMSLSMHAAGVDMFMGTWVLVGLSLFLGHLAGSQKPRWWPLVADLAAAPRLAIVHALTFAIPVGVMIMLFFAIRLIVEGEGRNALTLVMLLPAWGLTALAMLPGLGMLVVPIMVTARGDVSEFGLRPPGELLWFFDLPWYAWIPMVLVALLVLLLMPILWNRDRVIAKDNVLGQVASWLALPCAYFVCSLILLALVWTSFWMDMGMVGSVGASFGLGMWMPLVAFFLGCVVELLARFVAPLVDRFVPGFLVGWFRRSDRKRPQDTAAAS